MQSRSEDGKLTAEAFAAIRKNARLSIREMADLLAISQMKLRQLESGQVPNIPDEWEQKLVVSLPAEVLLAGESRDACGVRLRELRESLGHTQTSFADALGVCTTTISRLEAGTIALRPKMARQICAYTSADYCYLMYGAKPSRRGNPE